MPQARHRGRSTRVGDQLTQHRGREVGNRRRTVDQCIGDHRDEAVLVLLRGDNDAGARGERCEDLPHREVERDGSTVQHAVLWSERVLALPPGNAVRKRTVRDRDDARASCRAGGRDRVAQVTGVNGTSAPVATAVPRSPTGISWALRTVADNELGGCRVDDVVAPRRRRARVERNHRATAPKHAEHRHDRVDRAGHPDRDQRPVSYASELQTVAGQH